MRERERIRGKILEDENEFIVHLNCKLRSSSKIWFSERIFKKILTVLTISVYKAKLWKLSLPMTEWL